MLLSSRPVRLCTAAAATAGLVVLGGCGSSGSTSAGSGPAPAAAAPTPSAAAPPAAAPAPAPAPVQLSPVELVAHSSDVAKEAGSARIALDSVTKVAGQTQKIHGEGLVDTAQQASQLRVQLPGSASGATIEALVVDGKSYVRGVPGAPAGKWVLIPTPPPGSAQAMGSSDPTEMLSMLRRVSDDVRVNGSQQVRGVKTTRYTGTLDLNKAVAQQRGQQAEQSQKALQALGIREVPFDVFLDEQGRPARFRLALSFTVSGKQVRNTTSVDFFDWGTDVDLSAPDPADVTKAPRSGSAPA